MENRGPATLAVTVAMVSLSTVFVSLRILSRAFIVRRFSWDDWCMVAAWIIALGMSIAICLGTSFGLGRHERDVPVDWDSSLRKTEYAFAVLYNPALMATKTSILIFYLTLSKTQKIFRYATLATLAVVNIGGLALTFLNIFQCTPVSAAFKNPVPSTASCTDILTLYLSSAPLNVVTDFAMLVLPMPILTAMRLPRKQKVILIITFSFGIFVTVVDVVRIAYLQSAATKRLQRVQEHLNTDTRNSEDLDYSWYASYTFMWSAVEVHVGMMCACVPGLKPLVSRFLPAFLRDGTDDRTKRYASCDVDASLDMGNGQLPAIPESPAGPNPPRPAARQPPLSGGEPMDMMEFLTTPDGNGTDSPDQISSPPHPTRATTTTFFDFVNVEHRKSMVNMTTREAIFPFTMVTVLFFVWGFAYGLLDVLNSRFQQAANMTKSQSIGIHSAYFGAYFVGPMTFGRLVFKYWGFKACYMVGLVIYACGTLVFWPAAVLSSFSAFLISNFIVGLGLSTLEISANPFIALCGPPQYAEVRLNLSQAIQAIGTVVSPILAQKVLFKVEANTLIDVQWTYLGISIFTLLLALGYYYVPLPEATDAELAEASERADAANRASFQIPISGSSHFTVKVIFATLALGVLSQFCYVGAQETVSTSFASYIRQVYPSLNEENHQAIGHAAFAMSRFIAAFLNLYFFKARHLLLFSYAASITFAALCMNWSGATPAAMVILVYFFQGPIFSFIFAMSLRGMGRHTKDAATLLTAGISGGAVWPPIAYGALNGHSPQYSFCIVVAAFAVGSVFAIYLEVFSKAKLLVDPDPNPRTMPSPEVPPSPPTNNEKRPRWFSNVRHKLPTREHRERRSWASSQRSNPTI